MTELEIIKRDISILDLANEFNAQPNKNGKCKHNPLREERTSSLQLYLDTNTYSDFGSKDGSSVIDFYMKATGSSVADTIKEFKNRLGIKDKKDYTVVTVQPKQDYLLPNVIDKIFNKQEEVKRNNQTHQKELLKIAPKWCFDSASNDSIERFFNIFRYSKHEKTGCVLLSDEHGTSKTVRFRRKELDERVVKWYALPKSESSVLYTNFTDSNILLILEGTHDYLSAILMGYSVIALPSSNYNNIPSDLLAGRKCIFIDDDDDKNFMLDLYNNSVCDKVLFNHKEFKEFTKCDSKDFSDYLTQFNNLEDWQNTFDKYINSLKAEKLDFLDILNKKGGFVTRELIKNAEDTELYFFDLLASNQITVLVGQANVGKSALTLSIANTLFDDNTMDNLLYFDNDNSLSYTKDRILKLMDRNGDDKIRFYNGSSTGRNEMIETLKELSNLNGVGNRSLLVIDSLKDFVNGSVNSDESINEMFDLLKKVRDGFGATIIVLHHTKKNKTDDGDLEYVGSQSIRSSCDNMIYIDREDDIVITIADKMRAMIKENGAFDLDFENMEVKTTEAPIKKGKGKIDTTQVLSYIIENEDITQKDIEAEFGKCRTILTKLREDELVRTYKIDDVWFYKAVRTVQSEPEIIEYNVDDTVIDF